MANPSDLSTATLSLADLADKVNVGRWALLQQNYPMVDDNGFMVEVMDTSDDSIWLRRIWVKDDAIADRRIKFCTLAEVNGDKHWMGDFATRMRVALKELIGEPNAQTPA